MMPLNATDPDAAITLCSQQEMTMLKREVENNPPEVLTDDELELVSGGDIVPDAGGNIPICPPWWPGHPGPIPVSRG
jgi:hypothetical protein